MRPTARKSSFDRFLRDLHPGESAHWPQYVQALAATCLCTACVYPFNRTLGLFNVAMCYVLVASIAALRLGRGAAVLLCVANMLAFDFFFVPPAFSFEVMDTRYLFMLGVMLVVALVIANLMISVRRHRDLASARERRTAVLYAMSRELAVATDAASMAAAAVRNICAVFHSTAVVLMADEAGRLTPVQAAGGGPVDAEDHPVCELPDYDPAIAQHVVDRAERCLRDAIYLPLLGTRRVRGVIVVRPAAGARPLPSEQLQLLDAFAAQLSLSLQRVRVAQAAEAARLAAERVLLCNTLLASISHDLRTPLAAIAGAGSLISQAHYSLSEDRRTTLGTLIERKARDMSQLLSNVLELTKMELGAGPLNADWHAIDDLVALALRAHETRLAKWRVSLSLPLDLPLIFVDATLIVQILGNLLENATKYTPPGTAIMIAAAARADRMLVSVADRGPGLPPGDPERLFEKFRRGRTESHIAGVGLGLAICRAAARLHGGEVRAMTHTGGGARFEVSLPVNKPELQRIVEFDASSVSA